MSLVRVTLLLDVDDRERDYVDHSSQHKETVEMAAHRIVQARLELEARRGERFISAETVRV